MRRPSRHWLYWLAPVAGMIAAARVYDLLRPADAPAVVPRGMPIGIKGPIDAERVTRAP